jgi:adenylate cyclase class 2
MEILEIETRYRLSGTVSSMIDSLITNGYNEESERDEVDTYYTSLHKDFIASAECLRIRRCDGESTLTWKPPSTEEMKAAPDFWKLELDLNVTGQESIMRELLKALDFVEYVEVRKHRRIFRDGTDVAVTIDEVDIAGLFIEIETQTNEQEVGRRRIREVAERLGLRRDALDSAPYRDLVKNAERER